MNMPSEKKAPTFSTFKPLIVTDPQPVAQETRQAAQETRQAANGDDDLMSRQQQQAMPSFDEMKGKWKQHVGAAKITWGKLTEDEFLQLEGQTQKLTGLVQERYAITRDEAEKQVKAFFDKNKS